MASQDIHIAALALLQEIPSFARRGITEFCPELFLSLEVDVKTLDQQLVRSLGGLYCSVELPLAGTEKGGALLFDKKLYAGKAALLNREGLVFGFIMGWGCQRGDTFRAFRDRLDFALSLYPNHLYFPQLDEACDPAPTGVYSSKDMDFSRGMAFACRTFYTAGRAVPWFLSVLKALKISPSAFFAIASNSSRNRMICLSRTASNTFRRFVLVWPR